MTNMLPSVTKLVSQKLDGTLATSGRTTLGDFLGRWLEDSSRPTTRSSTYSSYKGIIKNHIKPKVGGVRLDRLTPATAQGLYSSLERDGVSSHNRRLAHAVLHRAFKQAVKWGMVPRNVCDAVDPPRVVRREIAPPRRRAGG